MAKIQKKSKQQFHLIPFFYFPPKDCPSGGQLSPLGFAACQSKNCSNRAVHAPTLQFSHRTRRTHRTFWQIRASHRLHRLTQIRRVWHPCHTHAATKLSSHRIRGTQKQQVGNILPQIAQIFTDVLSGGAAVPAAPTKQSCTNITILHRMQKTSGARYSPTDCGYAQIRRVWHPCHTHAATKLSSHRIHGTHRNDWRRRKICVHL